MFYLIMAILTFIALAMALGIEARAQLRGEGGKIEFLATHFFSDRDNGWEHRSRKPSQNEILNGFWWGLICAAIVAVFWCVCLPIILVFLAGLAFVTTINKLLLAK